MQKPIKISKGALPPLFDRIVIDHSGVGREDSLYDEREYEASIIREVSIILNTRCTVRKAIYKDHEDTIPFFGMPDFFGLDDFSYFDATNTDDWPEIINYIQTAILAAEPRLKDVTVKINSYDSLNQDLYVFVSGTLKDQQLLKEINFPLTIQSHKPAKGKAAA